MSTRRYALSARTETAPTETISEQQADGLYDVGRRMIHTGIAFHQPGDVVRVSVEVFCSDPTHQHVEVVETGEESE